jgi:hypothetical protein
MGKLMALGEPTAPGRKPRETARIQHAFEGSVCIHCPGKWPFNGSMFPYSALTASQLSNAEFLNIKVDK